MRKILPSLGLAWPRFFWVTLVALAPGMNASAAYSFFNRPLKLVACEMMLRGEHAQYSHKESVLPIVRDVKYRIEKTHPASRNDGVTYDSIHFSGPMESIKAKVSPAMVARLNGIEESLVNTNLDMQIYSTEIRGADIAKALEKLEAEEQKLEPIYQKLQTESVSLPMRAFVTYLNYSVINFVYSDLANITHGLMSLDPSNWGDVLVNTLYLSLWGLHFKRYLSYDSLRYDSYFIHLKDALRKAANGDTSNDFYMDSNATVVPSEFHKMLFSNDPSKIEEAREIATSIFGPSYTARLLDGYSSKKTNQTLEREVRNAGDMNRVIYQDHIVYYDTDAKEPVWLFFYRAYRSRPAGRKSPKKKQEQKQREKQWTPGLAPVPLRF